MSAATRTRQDTRDRDAGLNGHSESSNGAEQLSDLLRQQIAEALDPIVGDLRDQMVETVRSQVEESLGSDQTRKLQPNGSDDDQEGPQGGRSTAKKQRRGQKQKEQGAKPERDESGLSMQSADEDSPSLPQKLFQWLSAMALRALNTLGAWLSSIVDEVRQYVTRIVGSALVALLRPVLKAAIQKAFESLQQQGKDKLATVGQNSSR